MAHPVRTFALVWLALWLARPAPAQETQALFVFATPDEVHLRWSAPLGEPFEGFHVERRANGTEAWGRLTELPIAPMRDVDAIRSRLGASANALLGFFPRGATELDDEAWAGLAGRPDSLGLLRLMSVQQPELAFATGERFVDRALEPGQRFDYRVVLLAGGTVREWAVATGVQHGRADSVPAPSGVTTEAGDSTANLSWQFDEQLMQRGDAVAFRVFRGTDPAETFAVASLEPVIPILINGQVPGSLFTDFGLTNGVTYFYEVRAVNLLGFESAASARVDATPRDLEPPPAPRLEATRLADSMLFEWNGVDADDLVGYRVYRLAPTAQKDAEAIRVWPDAGLARNALSFLEDQIPTGQAMVYVVTAVDSSGNESPPSNPVEVFIADETPPAAPIGLVATTDRDGIALDWNDNPEADLLGYLVRRTTRVSGDESAEGQFFAVHAEPLSASQWRDPVEPTSQSRYAYHVVALDQAGNESTPSETVIVRMPDRVAPDSPTLTRIVQDGDLVRLRWLAPAETELAGWRIYVSVDHGEPTLVAELPSSGTLEFEHTPAPGAELLGYSISALDLAGNESERSAPMTLRPLDLSGPQPPELSATHESSRVVLAWRYPKGAEEPASQVLFRAQGENGEMLFLSEIDGDRRDFRDTEVAPDQVYRYALRAVDQFGNFGPESAPVRVQPDDRQPR